MSTDTPRPERVTLTDEERQRTYEHFAYSDDNDDVEEMHLGKCLLVEDFESILAAREQALREEIAGGIEAQRDEYLRGEGRWTLFDYAAHMARAYKSAARIARGETR